jgi:hypothetical protein
MSMVPEPSSGPGLACLATIHPGVSCMRPPTECRYIGAGARAGDWPGHGRPHVEHAWIQGTGGVATVIPRAGIERSRPKLWTRVRVVDSVNFFLAAPWLRR